MSDLNVRSDSVDVEQIMRQIRARIREKRGADYTEGEIQQLAKVKLEKFLDPKGVRSDLVDQFKKREFTPSPPLPKLELTGFDVYGTHRGILKSIRSLLNPILKLFINPNPLVHFVWTQAHAQAEINEEINRWMRRREQLDAKMDPLNYELMHNLVVELTRLGIEVHNLKMRVESLSSRLDFDERRSRSLEKVVEYRQDRGPRTAGAAGSTGTSGTTGSPIQGTEGSRGTDNSRGTAEGGARPDAMRPQGQGDGERRRRRRRRRRRSGNTLADSPNAQAGATGTMGTTAAPDASSEGSADAGSDDGGWDGGDDGGEGPNDEAENQ